MTGWLWRSIVATAGAILIVSVAQWGACRFYVLPSVWPWYAKYIGTPEGEKIDISPVGCSDIDSRTITVMMGVLTTLISLSRNAE